MFKKSKLFLIAGLLITACAVVVLVCPPAASKDESGSYNVIFITIDALRKDHLGCYGYPRKTSPFIDNLAADGILFNNAFSSCTQTIPAFASIFTSLYPVQHKALVNGSELDDSIFTMVDMFKEIGYKTAAFSSILFIDGVARGFDIFDSTSNEGRNAYLEADHVVDNAIKWLKGEKPDDRVFMWLHFFDTHTPYRPPAKFFKKMQLDSQTETDRFLDYLKKEQNVPMDYYNDSRELMLVYDKYDAGIAFVDSQIKRLFEYMNKHKLNKKTLWIITADHGEGLGNRYYRRHDRYIYGELVKVPLIFHFSDNSSRENKVDDLVRHVDLLPTLADIVEYPIYEKANFIQGSSMLGLIENDGTKFPVEYAFYQRRPKGTLHRKIWEPGDIYALQNLKFKYIYHSSGKDEFFDLENDPFENNNLISDASEIKDKMKKLVVSKYNELSKQDIGKKNNKIDKKHLKELKALGYLQ